MEKSRTFRRHDGIEATEPRKIEIPRALTFLWGKWNPISNSYGGKDQLNDRYSKPEESKIQFEVDGSGPVDLGTIALTTK